jgi:hypothetical protein
LAHIDTAVFGLVLAADLALCADREQVLQNHRVSNIRMIFPLLKDKFRIDGVIKFLHQFNSRIGRLVIRMNPSHALRSLWLTFFLFFLASLAVKFFLLILTFASLCLCG